MIKSSKGLLIESQNTFNKSNRALRQTVTNTTNSSTLLKTGGSTIFMSYESILTSRSSQGLLYFFNFLLGNKTMSKNQMNKKIKGTIEIYDQCD